MSITDDRLKEGETLVREESADFLTQLAKLIGQKRGGWSVLKVKRDDDGYIEICMQEHQNQRKVGRKK
jgi:hypothetical protein